MLAEGSHLDQYGGEVECSDWLPLQEDLSKAEGFCRHVVLYFCFGTSTCRRFQVNRNRTLCLGISCSADLRFSSLLKSVIYSCFGLFLCSSLIRVGSPERLSKRKREQAKRKENGWVFFFLLHSTALLFPCVDNCWALKVDLEGRSAWWLGVITGGAAAWLNPAAAATAVGSIYSLHRRACVYVCECVHKCAEVCCVSAYL